MNILIVSAHPKPASLTNALRNVAADELLTNGHAVRVSDLHALLWKAVVDRQDFPGLDPTKRLRVPAASGEAFALAH